MNYDTVHEQFKAVVRAYADRTAISDKGRSLSYAELDELAERAAGALASAGVVRGSPVILAMARSIDFVVAVLAVIRLGGVYVPAGSRSNADALRDLAARTRSAHVVVDAAGELGFETAATLVFKSLLEGAPRHPLPAIERHRDDCLYIMFTSGSTGAPKGVMIPDRGVLRLVRGTNYTQITPTDTIFLTADPAFDASTFEIWGALLNGARIFVASADFDPNALADGIERHAVTIIWLTAGLFHAIGANRPEMFRPLRQLLVGGDVLNGGIVRAVLDACPGLEIVNGYGPTENTTFTCCHRMTGRNPPADNVPIGLPVTGTTVHLLDDHGQRVPVGTNGTLHVGGDGVALGYLGRPDDPAFVRVPSVGDELLYNTGDLAVLRDGIYYFLGRSDSLVKIRGYRVSTHYVREQLYRLGYVQEAVIRVDTDPRMGKRLTAHLRLDDGARGVADVRRDCLSLMPSYMVPEIIRIVDQIALTKNGKVQTQQSVELL
ncbi:MAG: AMP-binding protein [Pseudomonadota bacterium]